MWQELRREREWGQVWVVLCCGRCWTSCSLARAASRRRLACETGWVCWLGHDVRGEECWATGSGSVVCIILNYTCITGECHSSKQPCYFSDTHMMLKPVPNTSICITPKCFRVLSTLKRLIVIPVLPYFGWTGPNCLPRSPALVYRCVWSLLGDTLCVVELICREHVLRRDMWTVFRGTIRCCLH